MRDSRSKGILAGKDMDGIEAEDDRQFDGNIAPAYPIRQSRLDRIGELLHLRKTGLETTNHSSSETPATPKIEAPQNPGGEMKG